MSLSRALSVRCLGCGSVYEKPLGHGTARDNPGCPKCAYVGWIPTEASFRAGEPLRFAEDLPQHPSSRPR